MRRNTTAALIALGACASMLTGCSSTLSASDVEDEIVSTYDADSAGCPSDLEATEGATVTCQMIRGEESLDLEVKVGRVDGDIVDFDMAPVE